eukprot:15233849-Alexandrium_andersonii.AAC.1
MLPPPPSLHSRPEARQDPRHVHRARSLLAETARGFCFVPLEVFGCPLALGTAGSAGQHCSHLWGGRGA